MTQPDLREVIEKKARSGDGAYAIAYALLDLSDSQEATAKALGRLGNGNASTDFGAIESLSMQLTRAAEILGEKIETAASLVANALDSD